MSDPRETIRAFVERVERRAEETMLKTGKLEGAHYAAMKAELAALSTEDEEPESPPRRIPLASLELTPDETAAVDRAHTAALDEVFRLASESPSVPQQQTEKLWTRSQVRDHIYTAILGFVDTEAERYPDMPDLRGFVASFADLYDANVLAPSPSDTKGERS